MTIKHKRSSIAGKVPETTDLELGQLALNTTDGKVFMKKSVSGVESVIEVGGGGGGATRVVGDVVVGTTAPTGGTWLEAGKYYSKSTYPELATALGDIPDIGKATAMPQANIPVAFAAINNLGSGKYNAASNGSNIYVVVGQSGSIVASVDSGATFKAVPSQFNNFWYSVRYLNGFFVACGQNVVGMSQDGINWRIVYNHSSHTMYDAAYGAGRYVVVGTSGRIWHSTDLVSWTEINPATSATFNYVIFANNTFVATSSLGVYYSTDGVSWTQGLNTSGSATYNVIYGGGYFVACANGLIRWSTNGVSWTTVTLSGVWYDIAFNGTTWVAVGNTNAAYTSNPTGSWSLAALGGSTTSGTVAWDAGGSRFVIGCNRSRIMTSSNGATWSVIPDLFGSTVNQANYVGSKLFLSSPTWLGTLSGSTLTRLATSGNSVVSYNPTTTNARSVAYGNGMYVYASATVNLPGIMLSSPDGYTWTPRVAGATDSATMDRVQFVNGTFLAMGALPASGNLWYSTNGIDWSTLSYGSSQFRGAAYGAGVYVVVGTNGSVYSGATITSLVLRTGTGSNEFTDVIFANGLFVAVGGGGACYTSPDGITWTVRVAGASTIQRVIWANSLFVAVGVNGVLFTSPDGVTWTSRTSNVAGTLNDVAWSGTRFVAAGASGSLTQSSDGVTWTSAALGISDTWTHVVWTGSRFLVNSSTSIMMAASTDGINWRRSGHGPQAASGLCITSNNTVFVMGTNGMLLPSFDGGLTFYVTNLMPRVAANTYRMYKLGAYYYACTNNGLFVSSDGLQFDFVAGTNGAVLAMAYSGTAWVVVASGLGSGRPAAVWKSTDGLNFSKVYEHGTGITNTTAVTIADVAYANGNFVLTSILNATAGLNHLLFTSADAVTWTPRPYFGNNIANSGRIASDGTTLISPTNIATVKSSDGGATTSAVLSFQANGAMYSNGVWVVTNTTLGAYASTDTTNWFQVTPPYAAPLAIYSDGRYLVGFSTNHQFVCDTTTRVTWTSPLKADAALAINDGLKPLPLRGSTLLAPLGSSSNISNAIPIAEIPLYSYNTSTTFWVPSAYSAFGEKAWIYAGA